MAGGSRARLFAAGLGFGASHFCMDGVMELAEIKVDDFGGAPVAEHNMPCPVCRKNPAVLLLNDGTFNPCHECSEKGWVTVKMPKWLRWLSVFDQRG